MMHIKITKLSRLENRPNGECPLGEMTEGYTVWGHCEDLPKVGEIFCMSRYKRNEVFMHGLFNTSVVQEIHQKVGHTMQLVTENSVYELEVLHRYPSVRNKPVFKPHLNKQFCMEQVSSVLLAVYDSLEKQGFVFDSVEEDNAFHDSLMLFLEETFDWPDYASYN